jgi:hypothetical protein
MGTEMPETGQAARDPTRLIFGGTEKRELAWWW